jgi:hypothetical protein
MSTTNYEDSYRHCTRCGHINDEVHSACEVCGYEFPDKEYTKGYVPKKQSTTRYALQFVRGPRNGEYVTSFTQHGWMFDSCRLITNAYMFDSATQAWCVAFCLTIDPDCEVIAVGQQMLF